MNIITWLHFLLLSWYSWTPTNTLKTTMGSEENKERTPTAYVPGNNSGNSSQETALLLDEATVEIARWLTPITVAFGLLGNLLTFLVVTRKKNRRISCCVYMAVLAVTDSYTLLSYMGFNACVIGDVSQSALCRSLTACRVSGYLMGTTNVSGTMLLVTLTIDRFMAVRHPLRARVYCTPRRARIASAVVLVFSFVYNIPHIFFSGFFKSPKGPACLLLIQGGRKAMLYSVINIVVVVLLPFLILLVLNLLIIQVIKERSRPYEEEPVVSSQGMRSPDSNIVIVQPSQADERRRSSVAPGLALRTHSGGRGEHSGDVLEEASRRKERDKQLTRMLLFVTFAYVILTAPQYARQTAQLFFSIPEDKTAAAIFTLFICIFQRLYYINFAINFYLYFSTGSKFRMDLFRMICCVADSRSPDMTDSQIPNTQRGNSLLDDRWRASMASNLNLATSRQNLRTEFVRQMSQNNGETPLQNFRSFFNVLRMTTPRGSGTQGNNTMARAISTGNLSPRIKLDANPIDVLLESQRRRSQFTLQVPGWDAPNRSSVSMSQTITQTQSDVITRSMNDVEQLEESIVTSQHVINIIRSTSQETVDINQSSSDNNDNCPPTSTQISRSMRVSVVRSSSISNRERPEITRFSHREDKETPSTATSLHDVPQVVIDHPEPEGFHTGSRPFIPPSWLGPSARPSSSTNVGPFELSLEDLLSAHAHLDSTIGSPDGALRRSVSERDVTGRRRQEVNELLELMIPAGFLLRKNSFH